jgi:cytochrome c553
MLVVSQSEKLRQQHQNNPPTMKKTIVLTIAGLFAAAMMSRAADVKENYTTQCAKCHGEDGKGQTKMGQKLDIKDFTDAKVQAAFKDEDGIKAIKEGITDKDGKIRMKAIEGLSDDDMKALIAYVRKFKT